MVFNCHTIDEAVFYYAFMHNMSYKDSLSLIKEINSAPSRSINSSTESNYTQFIQNRIAEFKSIDELKAMLDNLG